MDRAADEGTRARPRARRSWRWLALAGFSVVLAAAAACAFAEEPALPPALQDWQGWALHGLEYRRCPLVSAADPSDADSYRCAWPERLVLDVNATGGEFSQRWQVFAASWVTLPGGLEHWPREVRLDGVPAPVVAREGAPQLRLAPGDHVVTGRFRWESRPEALPVSPRTALLDLTVDGERVVQPERPGGAVWLGKRRAANEPAGLELQVYRLLRDGIPGRLLTRLRLQVAGEGREELFARVLPEGFVPVAMASELAARLDADGRLRVQVRPGAHEILLDARAPDVLSVVPRPKRAEGIWVRDEIWSFQADDRLRIAAVQGAESIDPAQANVPPEWQGLPAYRLPPDGRLAIDERSRGIAVADDNRLSLSRDLWLDFDHQGFTARDRLGGTLRRDWRLDMHAPFVLANAQAGGDTLLITAGAGAGETGIELRSPQLDLTTLARVEGTRGALPATGWKSRFDRAGGWIHLPPGHRLVAVISDFTDVAAGSWWSTWGLWSFFGLCIVVAMTYRVGGRALAAIAFGGMLLMYQEAPEQIWLWANVLVAVAAARAVPVEGRLRRWAVNYRLLSFAFLGIALLPLLFAQVRLALHPQLDTDGTGAEMNLRSPMVPPPMIDLGPDAVPAPPAGAAAPGAPEPAEVVAADAVAPESTAILSQPAPESRPRVSVDAAGSRIGIGAGLNVLQKVQRYAPGTVLQTGPGVPAWRYRSYSYAWSGPVEEADTLRVVYAGPLLLGIWRIAGVALLALWFILLLGDSLASRGRWFGSWPGRTGGVDPGDRPAPDRAARAAVVAILLLLASGLTPSSARAEATPDARLLDQLRQRLVEPPKCLPTCAEIMDAGIVVDGERLEVTLAVSVLARVAIAMPHAGDRWQLHELSVDGTAGLAMAREADGAPWVALPPGTHQLRLAGRLADVASVQLVFPQTPRAVRVSARGWNSAGVNDGRLVSGSLELTRIAAPSPSREAAGALRRPGSAGAEFPVFVRVIRRFDLGLDWSVATEVQRVAPERAAMTFEIPLVAGESVLTPGVEVTPRKTVLVGLAPDAPGASWDSGLARSASLTLAMPQSVARTEVWSFTVHPQWRVEFAGLPPVLPDDPDSPVWVYTYYPRAGERLSLKIMRPPAVPGPTLAIDSATQVLRLGARTGDAAIGFRYRSTQGGRHAIRLPAAVRVQSVSIDGAPLALRPEPSGELSLGVLPGEHRVEIRFEMPDGAAAAARPPPVDLGSPASNVRTTIELPASRWALLKFDRDGGPGPAILYWSELAAFLILAVALGRQSWSPLRVHEWLLLGLGLSTQSWGVLVLVALWFLALGWRAQWAPGRVANWRFNILQGALVLLTVVALSGLLLAGIKYGFLSTPDMGVTGSGSGGNTFAWFVDRTVSALPQPLVISVPIWVYKTLVFAWALWIAWRLSMHWLPWAWRAWTHEGFWRRRWTVAAATEPGRT
ncbi:MAG: hypothetical protein U1F14_16490 [Steroidobacteraceae bacterium]